eukprot:scaffold242043_cov18-Tisochrysis_lutea.AAC.1
MTDVRTFQQAVCDPLVQLAHRHVGKNIVRVVLLTLCQPSRPNVHVLQTRPTRFQHSAAGISYGPALRGPNGHIMLRQLS